MVPLLLLTFTLFAVGSSVAEPISGNYQVDWIQEWQNQIEDYDLGPPFVQPGVLLPGLTVKDIISAIGTSWHAKDILEVYGILCRDIAPSLVVPLGGPGIFQRVCDPIFDALNTNSRVDGVAICNAVYTPLVGPYRRRRRMAPDMSLMGLGIVRNFNFEAVLHEISDRVFDLHSYDQESVCNAVDGFLNSGLTIQALLESVGEVFLAEGIGQGSQICHFWDEIYDNLRRADEQTPDEPPFFQTLMEDVSQLIAEFSGFEDRESLCDAITEAAADPQQVPQAPFRNSRISSLADTILHNMMDTLIIDDQCTQFGNDVIDLIVNLSPYIDHQIIQMGIQMIFDMQSIEEACTFIDDELAFPGCAAGPCANGGRCAEFQDAFSESFRCDCLSGYTGTDCGIVIRPAIPEPCYSDPCLNGGSCMNHRDTYYCICMAGYYGTNCEYS
ncbi:uncharacterized protein LOC121425879 [Lytechinus variegatus]|uniref:uncharacterized protein LOC121425879 n=1 Tax=Lytechinus variegatus TaxID=7654 RepID=UPI001BB1D021|nr:uncharacterized protein LOC121425879 [Lytechinus variegatus]